MHVDRDQRVDIDVRLVFAHSALHDVAARTAPVIMNDRGGE
jgi:hypothetical protein